MIGDGPMACSTAAEDNSLPIVHTTLPELHIGLSIKGVADSVALLGNSAGRRTRPVEDIPLPQSIQRIFWRASRKPLLSNRVIAVSGHQLTPIYGTAQPVLVSDYTEVTDERLLIRSTQLAVLSRHARWLGFQQTERNR